MELTRKQEEGLRLAVERYKNKEPYTCIAGYAGSGKTTLVKFIIAALNVDPRNVAYVAFTGKAAEVLRKKGNKNAITAHKLLYKAVRQEDGSFLFFPKDRTEIDYKIIVVDEISMLPADMWKLLMRYKIYVIACGDPGQLPPVQREGEGDVNNHVLDKPHVFLDEIMRQAQDSEIIRLSMDIREGKALSYHKGTEVMITSSANIEMYKWADQIIVGTNATRRSINNSMRTAMGRGEDPEPGDKVISLANHWRILDNTKENALVNGTIGYLNTIYNNTQYYPIYYGGFPSGVPVTFGNITTETGEVFERLIIDRTALTSPNGVMFLTPKQEAMIVKNKNCNARKLYPPLEFNYGYAITCHRSQGSQWDKVLIQEERFPFGAEEHKRWLYTAVTRGAERVVLIR